MHSQRIDYRDGWLCVVDVDNRWNDPLRVSLWWPAQQGPRDMYEDVIGKPTKVQDSGTFGAYMWKNGPWFERRLKDGGQTLPVHTDHEVIPCPKVRAGIPTRYEQGRWQKRLKTGWIDA